jgi:tetratricopeptide (TPR) repeat protein
MDAKMKLYHDDAAGYLERAVELDPDFAIAKLMMVDYARHSKDKELAEKLLDEALSADLEGLKPRERFYLERAAAYRDKRFEEISKITQQYLEKYPNDPYILDAAALVAFSKGDNETAERLYRRLLELSPNWVLAYNQLGYITMLEGRFAEAEEYFTSYRFIAPDQANPHDSLGELYIVLGRYPEAAQSIETALDIKPDFWESYNHLMLVRSLMGDYGGARRALEEGIAREGSPSWLAKSGRCGGEVFMLEADRRWSEIFDQRESECVVDQHPAAYSSIVTHRAASQLGEWEVALELERRLEEKIEKAKQEGLSEKYDELTPTLMYMRGVRLALSGDLEGAEINFRGVDNHLTYRNSGLGLFKISNRIMLVETLLSLGQDADAHKLLAQVRAVNPVVVSEFEENGLKAMGLSRS